MPITGLLTSNSRAKIKMLAKKSLESGEDMDSIPESMRQYLAMQAMESGKGIPGFFGARTGLLGYGHQGMMGGEQSGPGKVCKWQHNTDSTSRMVRTNSHSDPSSQLPLSHHR